MIEILPQAIVLKRHFRLVPFSPLTVAKAALPPALPFPRLDSRRIERSERLIQLENDPRHGTPWRSFILLTESTRTASCKLGCKRHCRAFVGLRTHPKHAGLLRAVVTSQKPIFSRIKVLFAILRLNSPMRRGSVSDVSNLDDISDVA